MEACQLLDLIDKIDQVTWYSEMEVCMAISDTYAKHAAILSQTENEYLVQESIGDKIKLGVAKVWKTIKAIFNFIAGLFRKLVDFVKGLFKKRKKTGDQIADELNIEPKSSNSPKDKILIKIKRIRNGGVPEPFTVEAVAKTLTVSLNGNDSFIINSKKLFGYMNVIDSISEKITPHPDRNNRYRKQHIEPARYASSVLWLFQDKTIDSFGSFFEDFITAIKNDDNNEYHRLEKLYRNTFSEYNTRVMPFDQPIKYSKLTHIQKTISKIANKFDEVRLEEVKNIKSDVLTLFMNNLYRDLNDIQMGLNALYRQLMKCNIVDARYHKAIDDIETLGKFVKKSIDAGCPPEDIIQNCVILSSDNLMDKNTINESAGQSRFVMFPKDESVVYKLATSGFGLSSNRSEYIISNETKHGIPALHEWIALTYDQYNSYSIISQERCKPGSSSNEYQELLKNLANILNVDENKKYDMMDIHTGNCGYSNRVNHVVAYDYGYLLRKDTDPDNSMRHRDQLIPTRKRI